MYGILKSLSSFITVLPSYFAATKSRTARVFRILKQPSNPNRSAQNAEHSQSEGHNLVNLEIKLELVSNSRWYQLWCEITASVKEPGIKMPKT